MNLIQLVKIFASKILYIIVIPIIVSGLVFVATKGLKASYVANSTVYTGVTSNTGLTVEAVRIDNIATQNEYNNIMAILKTKTYFEEIALSLLAQHLILEKPEKQIISDESFAELMASVPDDLKSKIVKSNFEATLKNIKEYIQEDEKNYIYRLLNYGHKYYSVQAIGGLKAERVSNSDIVKLTFQSQDPGIAFNTVKFATSIFLKNYNGLKISMSNSAVAYFEQRLREIQEKLDKAEQNILEYSIENDIINYYEQTEQVTTQQEKIEMKLQEVKMEFESSISVLEKLEKEVESRYNINLRNSSMLSLRQELVDVNNIITAIELNENSEFKNQLSELKSNRFNIENRIKSKLDSIYIFENKSQGIETQKILSEWLDAVKNNQIYSSQFKSMKERQIEFMKQFKRYAPIGANIKRYEREIDVYEREYLSTLHHLSLARQNEQNINMRSTMKVFDEVKFPINSIKPPRKLYMIAASLFSVIFFLLAVLIIELMDKRIKKPSILSKYSGLQVLAAYSTESNKKYPDNEKINKQADYYIFEKLKQLSNKERKPIVIQICSTWNDAGKLFVASRIDANLKQLGFDCEIVNFNVNNNNENAEAIADSMQIPLVKLNDYNQCIAQFDKNIDFLISIYPSLSDGIVNTVLIEKADIVMLVYSANTSWSEADVFILDKVNKHIEQNITQAKLYGILTNVFPDNLEEIYGEIPKKRSAFRKLLKKLLKSMV